MKEKPKNNAVCTGFIKVTVCILLFFMTGTIRLWAVNESTELQQDKVTITGTVMDSENQPLVGVSVEESGSNSGITTNENGQFTLSVSNENAVISVSYLGFKSQKILLNNRKQLDIILMEDSKTLDEVVVIGYGTQRKGDVTSAISSVKAEDFAVGKITDAADLVKGKIAGLSVTQSSGDPNATSSIMLRGITTLLGSVTPLILVDGIEGSLNSVAPDNIASIDVLKDASAAAIYGTRGANGVILITTKSGKRESRTSVSYSGYLSLSDWYKTADFMDTNDVIYGRTNFPYEGYDTDWLKAVTRKAGYTQNHSLSLNGGSSSSTYSANVTYSDDQGIMRMSDNQNLKMQLDLTQYALKDILKFNFNLLYGTHKNTNNNDTYVYRQALIHNPSSPVYNDDGSYYEEFSRFQYYNPVEIQNEMIGDTRTQNTRIVGNITLEPIKGWQTNLMLSSSENINRGETYYTSKYYGEATIGRKGWAAKSEDNGRSDNLELTSRYDFSVNKSRISALAGYSYLYNVYDGFSAGNGNFPSESYLYNNLVQGTWLTDDTHSASMGSYKNDDKLIGFFGRVSYGYDNRFNAMLSIRYEGSSKFGDNHKWGTFPAASLGWTINNEKFMKDAGWLNNLKFRVGYGVTGLNPMSSYASQITYDYDAYGKHLSTDGVWTPSLMVAQNPNPNLEWEKTGELNIGMDWSVLNKRLNGSVDVYNKKTTNLIYNYNVPVPPNMYGTTMANVGQMLNRGIEIMINAIPVSTKDFEYNTTFTLSHNSNKLLSLSNNLYVTDNFMEVGGLSDPISVPTHCVEVGSRMGDFWGLKSVGVSTNGFPLIEVSDGNGGWVVKEFDTKYNDISNRQRLGNGLPQVYAGWNNTFRYKNFSLSMQFTSQLGFKILNALRCFYENNSIAYNRLKSAANWYGAVDATGAPVIDSATGVQKSVQLSNSLSQGFWSDQLENGDFVKLSNLTIGYDIPLSSTIKNYIERAHIYVSGQNLFCITGYSGLDPEVSNYYWSPGIDDRDKYPTVRSFTVGLNINF